LREEDLKRNRKLSYWINKLIREIPDTRHESLLPAGRQGHEKEEQFTYKKRSESVKKRKTVPIFKEDQKRRNLNYLLILISCKKVFD